MPIKAKDNGSYKDVIDLMNVDESIDYVIAKTSSSYKRVYTATRSIEDVPPTTFKSIKSGANLSDYRIYGQTVDDKSVGDKTENLFDENNITTGIGINDEGNIIENQNYFVSDYIPAKAGDYTLSLTKSTEISGRTSNRVLWFDQNKENPQLVLNYYGYITTLVQNMTAPSDGYFKVSCRITDEYIMLNSGSTATPYEPYGYKVPMTVSNGTDTLTTPIYLPEQIRKVGDEAEYIDYGAQKMRRVRKNLLQNTATSQTTSGFAATVNGDGSVTCNGIPSETVVLYVRSDIALPEGTYILTGCPQGGPATTKFKLDTCTADDHWYTDIGDGKEFNITNFNLKFVRIVIYSGYTCDNLTFYPMIRLASIEDDTYEPYIENTEVDVTLPALPTLTGTNVLSVGTEVQPSKIDITGHIKTISGGS